MLEFKNKVLIIGYGSVAKCSLPILLKHIKILLRQTTDQLIFIEQISQVEDPFTNLTQGQSLYQIVQDRMRGILLRMTRQGHYNKLV